jgi:hypothetical protein
MPQRDPGRDDDQLLQDLREDVRKVEQDDPVTQSTPVFEPATDEEGKQEP